MNIFEYAEAHQLSINTVLDFTSSVNPLGPSTKAKNALRKGISDIHIYPDESALYLTRLICRRESIAREQLFVGRGSTELIETILLAKGPTNLHLLSPISGKYRNIAAKMGINIRSISRKSEDNTADVIRLMQTGLGREDAIIIVYPHNLTGFALPMKVLEHIIDRAEETGTTVIIDESYREFTGLESPVQKVIGSRNSFIVRSFSLFYALPGIPLGYIIGPAHSLEAVKRVVPRGRLDSLSLLCAKASLQDRLYHGRTRTFLDTEKTFIQKTLGALKCLSHTVTECPFFLLEIGSHYERLKQLCNRYRIFIDEPFEDNGCLYLKIPVKKHKWNARFLKTLRNAMGAKRNEP